MGRREKIHISDRAKRLFDSLGLEDYDAVISFDRGETVSEVRDRIVYRHQPEGEFLPFYLKVYRNPGANRPLSQWVRLRKPRTLAEMEAHNLQWLEDRGYAAPKVLAWGGRMRGMSEENSFIVTEEMRGFAPFDEWLASNRSMFGSTDCRLEKRRLIAECAVLLRDLHERGFHHPYPYLRHFFIPMGDEKKVAVIDVDAAKISTAVSPTDRARGLAELLLSSFKSPLTQADRLRFYRAYCGGTIDRDLATQALNRFRQKLRRHPNRYAWVKAAVDRIPYPNALKDSISD